MRSTTPRASAIFEGRVRHRRFSPVANAFAYPMFMMYLDLDEVPQVFEGHPLWSADHFALAWLSRRDHLGDPTKPLKASVCDLVEERTGRRPDGPIRLLTHLRYFGYCFNPVSFYFCYDRGGSRADVIVAEVENTPWGERHCYVLDARQARSDGDDRVGSETVSGRGGTNTTRGTASSREVLAFTVPKTFHVSPFLKMNLVYRWWFRQPADRIVTHMKALDGDRRILDATMSLERREITPSALTSVLARYPFMTIRVLAAIYLQAGRLWRKRAPFFAHPAKRSVPEPGA